MKISNINLTRSSILLLALSLMLSMTGCSDLPFFGSNDNTEQGEDDPENENTGSIIPETPLSSGPATVSVTRATATTATFEGRIDNDSLNLDLDFVQVIVRYAEAEKFSAVDENLPKVVATRPDFDQNNEFTINLKELTFDTDYKFCVVVQYMSQLFYSPVGELRTANVVNGVKLDTSKEIVNSATFAGKIGGLADEDRDLIEVGMLISNKEAEANDNKGERIVFEEIAADGSVSVTLNDLIAPSYYYRTYVKQGEVCKYGKVQTFETATANMRFVKRIVMEDELGGTTWDFSFEYDDNRTMTKATVKGMEFGDGGELEYEGGYEYEYSRPSESTIQITPREFQYDIEDGESQEILPTLTAKTDQQGRVVSFVDKYEDSGLLCEDSYIFEYTPESYLSKVECNQNSGNYFQLSYTYTNGKPDTYRVLVDDGEDYYSDYTHNIGNYTPNAIETPMMNIDLWRFLVLYMSDTYMPVMSLNVGTIGKYLPERVLVEYGPYDDIYHPYSTTDKNYREERSTTYEGVVDYDDELSTAPIGEYVFDKEGYPVAINTTVKTAEMTLTVVFEAGEVIESWDGNTYYEVVETDRTITKNKDGKTYSHKVTIEYLD